MADTAGRPNQRRRTRKDLLEAATRLMRKGLKPTLEDVAEEALVSRATAYRYFPSVEQLLVEAALDVAMPTADEVLRGAPLIDPLARLEKVDVAFESMMSANEAGLRMMLAQSMQRSLAADTSKLPKRQNRRSPMIDAALAPAAKQFKPVDLQMLSRALALVIGTEAMVVFKDVLQISDAEARKVRRWTIRALVEAAKK
ncbi:MAG: helix-turn-helix domain-containing protein [Hyphomonadaceae bacterium]|nr:helix-turn-helix domain-containing protein [Hyphomonadaceae bacterium]